MRDLPFFALLIDIIMEIPLLQKLNTMCSKPVLREYQVENACFSGIDVHNLNYINKGF